MDEVWARTEGGETQFYLADELGSTAALVDGGGTVQTQYAYGPFGATQVSGAPSPNPFQFTGRENDGTGLYYLRNRYYSPALARFISEDPVTFMGGGNFYAYVGNNPCTFVDPLGLGPCGVGRFTRPLAGRAAGGREFSALDLNYALALVYAEQTPSYRRTIRRREFDAAGRDFGLVTTEVADDARVFEAQAIASVLVNRLGHRRFGAYRGPDGRRRGPQDLIEVIFAPGHFAPVDVESGLVPALRGDPGIDCARYRRAYAAVRDTVTFGPLFDFDASRGVVQDRGPRTLRRHRGESNYGGSDFWRERP